LPPLRSARQVSSAIASALSFLLAGKLIYDIAVFLELSEKELLGAAVIG